MSFKTVVSAFVRLCLLVVGASLLVNVAHAADERCEDFETLDGCNVFGVAIGIVNPPTSPLLVTPDGRFVNGNTTLDVEVTAVGCLNDGRTSVPLDIVYEAGDVEGADDFVVLAQVDLPTSAIGCEVTDTYGADPAWFTVSLDHPEVIASARRIHAVNAIYGVSVHTWRITAIVDPFYRDGLVGYEGVIDENGLGTDYTLTNAEFFDNLASDDIIGNNIIPLSGDVFLGGFRTSWSDTTPAWSHQPSLCGTSELYADDESLLFDPGQGSGSWQTLEIHINGPNSELSIQPFCMTPDVLQADAAGVPLVVQGSVGTYGHATGAVGGGFEIDVTFDLGTSGILFRSGVLTLPGGLAWHELQHEVPREWGNGHRGFASPRGRTRFPLGFAVLSSPDFNRLRSDPFGPGGDAFLLTSEALPFAVEAQAIVLDLTRPTNLQVDLQGPFTLRWLRDPQAPGLSGRYAPLDFGRNRAISGQKPWSNDVIFSEASADCVLLTSKGLFASTRIGPGAGQTHFPRADLTWTESASGIGNASCTVDVLGEIPEAFDVQASRLLGRPADPAENARVRASVRQRSDCPGCGPVYASATTHTVPIAAQPAATYALTREGTLSFAGSLVGPVEWGPDQLAQGALATAGSKVFRHFPSALRARFVVPGFFLRGTQNGRVTDYLLGAFDASGHATPATDPWSKRGNGFFAGLTVGPETYRDNAGQPQDGEGETLAGDSLFAAFGGPTADGSAMPFHSVLSSAGTKYFLRMAGVTGAFNFQSVPTITAYGFPLALTRFAFGLVANVGQKASWVDGQLDLPTWAGFAVPFSSLELQCSGHFGGGTVDRGRLAALPDDDKRLAGWKAPYAIAEVAFAPKPPATQCSAGDRELETGGSATFATLSKALDLTSYWQATGEPSTSNPPKLSGQATVEFARPSVEGENGTGFFLDVLASKVLLARTAGGFTAASRGWIELGGTLRLPFWRSPEVLVRVQNRLDGATAKAERTLIRRPGPAFSSLWHNGNDDDALWGAATAALPPTDATQKLTWDEARFDTPFPWIFDQLRFPMRWSPDDKGRPLLVPGSNQADPGADLGILKVQAAATRTTPRETEIKFGASADLNVAAAISIPTSIDIFSQESVSKVDELLRDITGNEGMKCPDQQGEGGPSGPLWCVVKHIRSPSKFIARTVGPMFSGFISAQVGNLVDLALGPVLDKIGELITTIQSAPAALVNAGLAELTKAIDQGLAALTTPLSNEVRALHTNVPARLEDALKAIAQFDPSVSGSVSALGSLRPALIQACALVSDDGTCEGRASGSSLTLTGALKQVGAVTAEVSGHVAKVKSALQQGVGGLTSVVARAQCLVSRVRRTIKAPNETINPPSTCNAASYPELAPVFQALDTADTALEFFKCDKGVSQNDLFKKVDEIAKAIDQVLAAVESDTIPGVVQGVGGFLGVDLKDFAQALKEIGGYAKSIRARLNSAKTQIQGGFCKVGGGIDTIVAPVRQLLDKLRGPLDTAANAVVGLQTKLTAIIAEVGKVEGAITSRIQGAANFASEVGQKVRQPIVSLLALDEQLAAGVTVSLPAFKQNLATTFGCDPLVQGQCATKFRGDLDATVGVVESAFGLAKGTLQLVDPATDTTIVDRLAKELKGPIYGVIGTVQSEVGALFSDLVKQIPFPSKDELRQMLVRLVVNSDFVRDLDKLIEQNITLLLGEVDKVAARLVDQLNGFVRKAIELVNAKIRELLDGVTSAITGAVGFSSASLDGYAKIVGNAVQLLQIDARFDSKPSKGSGDEAKRKDEDQSFRASLLMKSWALSDKGKNCGISEEDAAGMLDASISVFNVPFTFGGQGGLKIQELSFGFTLKGTSPIGFNGGIFTTGSLDFKAFQIRDLKLAAGFGAIENYVGAAAAANFSGYDMSVAFLVGKTCDATVLNKLDPQFAGFVKIPGAFEGGYVRGSASIPIFNVGCLMKVGVGADFGAWFLNRAIGGLVGGSVFGQFACLASARGTVRMGLTYNTDNGSVFFKGQGWVAAGLGWCSPEKWLTVDDSREDGVFCLTMDASIDAEYEDKFELKKLDLSGPH